MRSIQPNVEPNAGKQRQWCACNSTFYKIGNEVRE